MKITSLVKNNHPSSNSSEPSSSTLDPTPDFEYLLELARLGTAYVRKNFACVETHRTNLLTSVETERRLREFDHWRESLAFTEQEKTALTLSEIISLHEPEKLTPQLLEEARRHFNTEEIVRLSLTIMAVNDWIDLKDRLQAGQ